MTAQLSGWDFTLGCEYATKEVVLAFLKEHCKHWAFQMEKGEETGFEHWQVRISLGVKRRKDEFIALGKSAGITKWRVSPTSTENRLPAKCFYILKPETRIDGPWTSDDKETYVPRQIRGITLFEWQQYITDDADKFDQRHINIVVETVGNKGKTILAQHCRVHGIGRSIPPVDNYKDMMRMVMDLPTSKLYIIDMPRAIDQRKMREFYAGIEELKGGHAWDDRYSFREKEFDCPNIWVFTNVPPTLEYLSADRWVVWNINGDKLEHLNRDRTD